MAMEFFIVVSGYLQVFVQETADTCAESQDAVKAQRQTVALYHGTPTSARDKALLKRKLVDYSVGVGRNVARLGPGAYCTCSGKGGWWCWCWSADADGRCHLCPSPRPSSTLCV